MREVKYIRSYVHFISYGRLKPYAKIYFIYFFLRMRHVQAYFLNNSLSTYFCNLVLNRYVYKYVNLTYILNFRIFMFLEGVLLVLIFLNTSCKVIQLIF